MTISTQEQEKKGQALASNVLLVEDNKVDLMLLSRFFKKLSSVSNFYSADCLTKARQILRSEPVDVVITDFYLPDGEGLELADETSVPLILLTASNDELVKGQSQNAGVEMVVKDFHGDYVNQLSVAIKKAQLRHKEKEEHKNVESILQDLMDNATDLIQSADMSGNLLFANKRWFETLGYNENQIGSLNVFEVVHPESHEHCRALLKDLGEKRYVSDEPVILKSAGGDRVLTSANISCRYDEKGNPTGTQAIFRNITNEVIVNEKLRNEEAKFQKLVESAVDTIYHLDSNGKTLFINHLAEKLTGYKKKELMELTYSELIHPDDFERAASFYANQIQERIEFTYYEFRLLKKNGDFRWVGQNVTLLLNEDNPKQIDGFLGVIRDINQSKKTEAELVAYRDQLEQKVSERTRELEELKNDFEKIFESVHDAILVIDYQNKAIVEANPAACKLYGYSKDEILNASEDRITGDLLDSVQWSAVVEELVESETREFDQLTKHGDRITVEGKFVPVLFQNRDAILANFRDITERKQLAARLEDEKKSRVAAILQGQEFERKKYATELHEEIGQVVIAQGHALNQLGQGSSSEELEEVRSLSNLLLDKIKVLSKEITPSALQDFGLKAAIRNYLETCRNHSNYVETEFDVTGSIPRIDSDKEIALYRMAQEAYMHALDKEEATEVKVELSFNEDQLKLAISDNGLAASLENMALKVIEERATIIGATFDYLATNSPVIQITISTSK